MNALRPLVLLSGCWLLAATAHAQATLRLGPSLTGLAATASLGDEPNSRYTFRPGFEAGVLASLQRGHFALQPALRVAQRGVGRQRGYPDAQIETIQLTYLALPVQLAYTQHADGRGFQVFAGPYLSCLLGGSYSLEGGFSGRRQEGDVVAASEHTVNGTQQLEAAFYTRRLDVGAQAGVGYQLGSVLLHVGYSLGLRNVATPITYAVQGTVARVDNAVYRNRAIQVSVSYLFGSKGALAN